MLPFYFYRERALLEKNAWIQSSVVSFSNRACIKPITFAILYACLILTRWYVVHGSDILIRGWGGDDGLYVTRAFWILTNGTLGPYTSDLLLKSPGFSFLLAAINLTGLPYLVFLELFLTVTALYLVFSFYRGGLNQLSCILVFAFMLFNPLSLSPLWRNVYREPAGFCFFSILIASSLCALLKLRDGNGVKLHIMIFTLAYSILRLLREEDLSLLWLYPVLVTIAGCIRMANKRKQVLFYFLFIPLVVGKGFESGLRHYVWGLYGSPILVEMGEGEYPKLVATIRSLDSPGTDPTTQITERALRAVQKWAPETIEPVQWLLTDKKKRCASGTEVCADLPTYDVIAVIRDYSFGAGRYKTAKEAQDFFSTIRHKLSSACDNGSLSCNALSGGIVPAPRWQYLFPFVDQLIWNATYIFDARATSSWGKGSAHTPIPFLENTYLKVVGKSHWDESVSGSAGEKTLETFLLTLSKCLMIIASFFIIYRLTFDPSTLSSLEWSLAVLMTYLLVRWFSLSYVSTFIKISAHRQFILTNVYFLMVALIVLCKSLPLLVKGLFSKFKLQKKHFAYGSILVLFFPGLLLSQSFELPTTPRVAKHDTLLSSPGFLAIAIQESHHPVISISFVEFQGPRAARILFTPSFPISSVELKFIKNENGLYTYEGNALWTFLDIQKKGGFSIALDTTKLEQSKLSLDIKGGWLADLLLARSQDTFQDKFRKWFSVEYQVTVINSIEASLRNRQKWDPLQDYFPMLTRFGRRSDSLSTELSSNIVQRNNYETSAIIKFTLAFSFLLSTIGMAVMVRISRKFQIRSNSLLETRKTRSSPVP